MQEIITTGLMTFGVGFTTAALSKAQGPGRALDDIMTLVGFEKLHEVAELKRSKRDLNVKQYKESIAQKIATIPEENIQEPPLSIVGPALEASKYYIEEESLREMFATLIASSMDSEKQDFIHPSFVEVIKQLTPSDANFIREMTDKSLPVGSIFLITKEESLYEELEEEIEEEIDQDSNELVKKFQKLKMPDFEKMKTITLVENYYISPKFPHSEKNQLLISSLERLGLLKVYKRTFTNNCLYDYIQEGYEKIISSDEIKKMNFDPDLEFKLGKNMIELTPYGHSFLMVCSNI